MTVKLLKQQHSCTKPINRQQPRTGALAANAGAAQAPAFGPGAGLLVSCFPWWLASTTQGGESLWPS
jgi:hypothetical protein